jgi:RNA polymerase sigma-70 factor, ECF subfamily
MVGMSPHLGWAWDDPSPPTLAMNSAPIPTQNVALAETTPREIANLAMDRYADGDDSAFGELYDVLAPRLHKYLLRQTRSTSTADDLLQQTMLQLHATRGRFFRGADVIPWAFAIARRLLIDGYRRDKREAARTAAHALEETPSVEGADDLLQAKRTAEDVDRELARLPEAQRVVFELMKKDGLSLKAVAQVLGTTTNAVKLRAHRAHVTLRIAMGTKGGDFDGE